MNRTATLVAAMAIALSPLLVGAPADARPNRGPALCPISRPCPPPCDFVQGCNRPRSPFLCVIGEPCPPRPPQGCEWVRPCVRRVGPVVGIR